MTFPNLNHDQAPLVALVHKQLAALEALAIEGHAEAASLRTDIAALAGQLGATSARLARLEATLQTHAQMLGALRAGLVQPPAPVAQAAAPSAAPAVTRPAPAAVAPAPAPEPPRAVVAAPVPAPAPVQPVAAPAPERVSSAPPAAPASTPAPPPVAAAPASPAPAPRPAAAAPAGPQVQRGSRVRVIFDDDTTETYTIVRQEEANRQRNLIGENSPLGAALLGATVGELRAFRVRPTGPDQMVEVLAIEG
jgi:hypothetical protein